MYAFDACNKLAPETRPAAAVAAAGVVGAVVALLDAGKVEEDEVEVEVEVEDVRPADDLEVI